MGGGGYDKRPSPVCANECGRTVILIIKSLPPPSKKMNKNVPDRRSIKCLYDCRIKIDVPFVLNLVIDCLISL